MSIDDRRKTKPCYVPYPPKNAPVMRGEKRDNVRRQRLFDLDNDKLQPKKPRPQQEIVAYVVPPRKAKKERDPTTGKFSSSPHQPKYTSYAGYGSRQHTQAQINTLSTEEGSAKSRRIARQDRAISHKKQRACREAHWRSTVA